MSTFQFIAGIALCLAALGVRAYLVIRDYGKEKARYSKNQR